MSTAPVFWRYAPDQTFSGNVRTIASAVISEAQEIWAACLAGEMPVGHAVHELRLLCKRLIALHAMVPKQRQSAALRRQIRALSRQMAAARDTQIICECLAQGAFSSVGSRQAERFDGHQQRALQTLAEKRWTKRLLARLESLDEAFQQLDLPAGQRWLIAGLVRNYRHARRQRPEPQCLHDLVLPDWHRWRTRCKTLQFQLQLIDQVAPARTDPVLAQLTDLTVQLGTLNDLEITLKHLKPRLRRQVFPAVASQQLALVVAAAAIGRALFQDRPKGFRRRLEALAGAVVHA